MNLLFVIPYPVFGGPHNEALRLAGPLRERGWNMTILLPNEPGNAAAWLRGCGIEVTQLPLHRMRATADPRPHLQFALGFAPGIAGIRRLIRRRSIDLVLAAGLLNTHAAIAGRLEQIPVVWKILDSRTPATLRSILMPLASHVADALMFTGHRVMEAHLGSRRVDIPTFVYSPPVATNRFRQSNERRLATRRSLNIPEGAPVVGMVANLNPQKGIEYFIRAAAVVYAANPEVHFLVVGSHYAAHSRYSQLIQDELTKGDVPSKQFIFIDARPDVENCYPAMDVNLVTAVPRSEGITTTLLEAMACSVPVIATDVGALREVVFDGKNGFLVPALDPEAIASATNRLLEDPVLRERMGAEGRRRAVDHYDVRVCTDIHLAAFEAAIQHCRVTYPAAFLDRPGPVVPDDVVDLAGLLVCPGCRHRLNWFAEEASCTSCGKSYQVDNGIPILLQHKAMSDHDELKHHQDTMHKVEQAAFFDHQQAEEFEVNRPHETPRLYRWIMAEKFRRSVAALARAVPNAKVLTVCGGSGMDAEFLARTGARVITSDISLGAAQRSQERARRYGLAISSIVADVEDLPFRDRSVDVVYVHDGLHHLKDPVVGLAEMARVAGRAISISEPSRSALTALAVRLGLALEQEEAGNRVARLNPKEVAAELHRYGYQVVRSERYGMYYRHHPGRVFASLSNPFIFPLVQAAVRGTNKLAGRFGNKLTVQAVLQRPPDG